MEITAFGHKNIAATHATTLEITTEPYLTQRGTCIIGVNASHSLSDLRAFLLPLKGSHLHLVFRVDALTEIVCGFLHPALSFTDTKAIVIRKSSFLCPRTLLTRADKAAGDFDRALVEKMKVASQKMTITLHPLLTNTD